MCADVLRLLVLLLTSLPAVLVSGDSTHCMTDEPALLQRHMRWRNSALQIGLHVSDRPGSRLVGWLFTFFLREMYGYNNVTFARQPETFNMSHYMKALSDCPSCPDGQTCGVRTFERPCHVPAVTINLEAWVPAGWDVRHLERLNNIAYMGTLGPTTRIGWFLQENVTAGGQGIVEHWREFQRSGIALVFNCTETERQSLLLHVRDESGSYNCADPLCEDGVFTPDWCSGSRCAVLLSSTSDEAGYVLRTIVKLRLYVQVYWVGKSLTQLVTSRTRAGRSVLFAHYTPSILTLQSSYVEVALPPCPVGTICDTGTRFLTKFAWNWLKYGASIAQKALLDFKLSQEQYRAVLQFAVDRPTLALEEVACRWMWLNADRLKREWLPRGGLKNRIVIGGIFPISGDQYKDPGVIPAVKMARDAINSNSSILANYELRLVSTDGQCSADMVMKHFINYLRMPEFPQMVGILGPACSNTLEPIVGVSRHFKVLVISYSAEGVLLSNRTKYPYFFRTIGENKQFRFVYKQLLTQLGWRRVAALSEAGAKYSEYISVTHDTLQRSAVSFVVNRNFPAGTRDMAPYLKDLKEKNARIIIADMYETAARALMCEAYRQGMTAKQGYIWFLPDWFPRDWYEKLTADTDCTSEEIMSALEGHLVLAHVTFASNDSLMQEGITVKQWREYYRSNCSKDKIAPSDYASFAYDATWTYALALDKLLTEAPSRYRNLRTDGTTKRLVELITQTDFRGVSGRLRFFGPARSSITEVKQWLNRQYYRVGQFEPDHSSPEGGRLQLDKSKIRWMTKDGRQPGDGSLRDCQLQPLADLLGTDCQTTLIIVNIVGLLLVVVLLVSIVLFYKRRYVRLRELATATDLDLDGWEVKRENIVLNRKLGEGAFGFVYGGEALLENGRQHHTAERKQKGDQTEEWCSVAVKTLKLNSSRDEKLDFLSEAEVMKGFNHSNIVQLLGVCTLSEPILTVMEFMLYGDLKTFLLSRRSLVTEKSFKEECHELSDGNLTSMARDVACALSYLSDMKYVHRDVACRNCLVNAKHMVKLADFGMTRSMCENDYYKFHRDGKLPVRWMAPESLADGLFTPRSDVWSYGVLLFEMTTFGSFPFQGLTNGQVLDYVRDGGHVTIPAGVKVELAELLLACWAVSPEARPDATQLVQLLGLQYPRMLSPCLDAPLSVVQLDGQPDRELSQTAHMARKRSLSLQTRPRPAGQRAAAHELADVAGEAGQLLGGSVCTPPASPSLNGKYVSLDHRPSLVVEALAV